MKIIKLLTLCFFGLGLPATVFSQGLNVVYNAQTGQIRYLENGHELSGPRVKKGQPITLRIENYNNYIYDVDIAETYESIKPGSGSIPFGNLQALGMPPLVTPEFIEEPSRNIDADGVVDIIDKEPNKGGQEQMIRQLALEAESKLKEMKNLENKMQETVTDIRNYEKAVQFKAMTLPEVQKLKLNPMLPPEKIKTYSNELMLQALNIGGLKEPKMQEVIARNNSVEKVERIQSEHQSATEKYEAKAGEISVLNRQLLTLAPGRADFGVLFFSMEQASQHASSVLDGAAQLSAKLEQLRIEAEQDSLDKTLAIWYEFEALKANEFAMNHLAQADEDLVVFNVNLKRKAEAAECGAQEIIQLSPIKVPVYGDLKINASVGINFGGLFSPVKSYTVRDSVIYGQKEDSFQPMISSNLHFYRQGPNALSVGGTLGIGLPIGSDTGFQSVNFFLGPSLFFGHSERIVLNMGIMGGKTRRLSEGYSEGDYFDNETVALPLHYPYELGYFIGLSFNLSRGG